MALIIIRGLLFIPEVVGFTGFIIPLIKRRILNIGNAAGLMLCSFGAVSAKTAWWLLPTYYARELFGVLYEWCRIS